MSQFVRDDTAKFAEAVTLKIRAANQALGGATATKAIERALDLAVFQRELVDGTRAMLGVELASPDLDR